MKIPFASFPFFALTLITLTGLSGCVSSTTESSNTPTVPTETKITIDTSTWTQDSIGKNFVFSYPAELNFYGGGDVDHGSYSFVTGEYPEDIYFTVFDRALIICPLPVREDCEIEKLVAGTVEETFAETIENFTMDNFYFPAETINIAGTTGQKFRIREDRNDGVPRTTVVFYNAQGVYEISDSQVEPNSDLFNAFLGTFAKK